VLLFRKEARNSYKHIVVEGWGECLHGAKGVLIRCAGRRRKGGGFRKRRGKKEWGEYRGKGEKLSLHCLGKIR